MFSWSPRLRAAPSPLCVLGLGAALVAPACTSESPEADALREDTAAPARGAPADQSTARFVLAFDGCVGRRCGIFVAHFDSARPRFLARGSQPKWSRDGREITFRCERTRNPTPAQSANNGNDELCVVDVASSRVRNLTRNWVSDYSSGWSPDGRLIAFASAREDAGTYNDIFVMRPDGSGVRQVTAAAGVDEYPSWSPDGETIAYHCQSGGRPDGASTETPFGICIVGADGTPPPRSITSRPGRCLSPAFGNVSPRLAYTCERGERPRRVTLLTSNRDGSDAQAIARGVRSPVWSPDDRWIFVGRGGAIVRMRAAGTAATEFRLRFRLPHEFEYDLFFLP